MAVIARIIQPATATGFKLQLTSINVKHVADGASSPLIPYLTEQNITLANVVTNATAAETHDVDFSKASRDGEKFTETRDKLWDPSKKIMRDISGYLKKLFRGNIQKMGDYGFTVNGNRVVIPSSFEDSKKLWDDIFAKHTDLGAASPLTAFATENDFDMSDVDGDMADAQTAENNRKAQEALKEEKLQLRNNLLNIIAPINNGLCQFLKGHYANAPKKLGDYGIRVDDSPQGSKRRKGTVAPNSVKVIAGALVGGLFINIGIVDLQLFLGKTTTGTPITVATGGQYVIGKGGSTLSVKNSNVTSTASYMVDCSN